MRSILALILIWCAVARADPDGGTQVDLSDAGIYQVESAVPFCPGRIFADGGFLPGACPTALGPGWWMSDDRMFRTGSKLAELQNENAELRASQPSWMKAALIGFGIGATFGVGAMIWVFSKTR